MIHSLNERPSKLEFKSDIISVFRKNKISEVVRVTNVLYVGMYCGFYEIRIITRDLDHINIKSSDLAEIYRDLTYGQTPTTHEISAQ